MMNYTCQHMYRYANDDWCST